jgi:hypothetical protein
MICALCEQEKEFMFDDGTCFDCFDAREWIDQQAEEIICSDFESSLADESAEDLQG